MNKIENGVVLSAAEYERLIRKKKPKTSSVVLLVMGLFLLVFITIMIVTFWRFQAVPDTLIQYTLGAGGIEAVVLAGIKISKVMKGEKEASDE